jgi:hypothetical protein
MKRILLILISGLVMAVAAYSMAYVCSTWHTRSWQDTDTPELSWLKDEFRLSDEQFARITRLHDRYLPDCAGMCRRIVTQQEEINRLLSGTDRMNPEIEAALLEAAELRAECQRRMLGHFYEVSRVMPPDQGQRYLQWVQQRTLTASHSIEHGH